MSTDRSNNGQTTSYCVEGRSKHYTSIQTTEIVTNSKSQAIGYCVQRGRSKHYTSVQGTVTFTNEQIAFNAGIRSISRNR